MIVAIGIPNHSSPLVVAGWRGSDLSSSFLAEAMLLFTISLICAVIRGLVRYLANVGGKRLSQFHVALSCIGIYSAEIWVDWCVAEVWMRLRMFWCFSLLLNAVFVNLPLFIRSATLALAVTISMGECLGEVRTTCSRACSIACVCVLSGPYVAG